MSEAKLVNLDAMRGIAALFVFFRHTDAFWGSFGFFHSYLAVDVFFVLSGFVIAHAYEEKFISSKLTFKKFATIRLIRLYPMYFIGLFIGLVVVISKLILGDHLNLLSEDTILLALILSVLFLPNNLGPGQTLFPLNPPSWSLFYELAVNLIYGLIRRFLNATTLSLLLTALLLIVAYSSFKIGNLDIGAMAGPKSMFGSFSRAFFGIFLGLALHRIYLCKFTLPAWLNHQLPPLLIMSAILMSPNIGASNWLFDLLCVAFLLPLCVYLAANTGHGVLPAKYCLILGVISYPLYAIHKPLDELFKLIFGQTIQELQPFGGIALLILCLSLSLFFVRYIDEPLRKKLGLLFLKPEQLKSMEAQRK